MKTESRNVCGNSTNLTVVRNFAGRHQIERVETIRINHYGCLTKKKQKPINRQRKRLINIIDILWNLQQRVIELPTPYTKLTKPTDCLS